MDTIIIIMLFGIIVFLFIIACMQTPTRIFKKILSTLKDIEKHLNTIEENTKNNK